MTRVPAHGKRLFRMLTTDLLLSSCVTRSELVRSQHDTDLSNAAPVDHAAVRVAARQGHAGDEAGYASASHCRTRRDNLAGGRRRRVLDTPFPPISNFTISDYKTCTMERHFPLAELVDLRNAAKQLRSDLLSSLMSKV